MYKTCSKCDTHKNINQFHKLKLGKFGVHSICKQCRSLSRKRYNPPELGMDIDYVYDNQIRASLLTETLVNYSKNKSFEMVLSQVQTDSTTYYVIHPLLKHIAILSIKE